MKLYKRFLTGMHINTKLLLKAIKSAYEIMEVIVKSLGKRARKRRMERSLFEKDIVMIQDIINMRSNASEHPGGLVSTGTFHKQLIK